jgi:toxin ParE1/3/4
VAYLVEFTSRAERDFIGLFEEIRASESGSALRWYRGLRAAVLSLEEMPNRCPVTRESARLQHFLYGRKQHVYRVIYRVFERQKRVEVLHIRHGARQDFSESDLD